MATKALTTKNQNLSVEQLIARAIDKGTPVETMERILAMAEKVKAGQAKEAFNQAMADFQRECPTITKTKIVKDKTGKVLYSYAPLESIVEQVKELLGPGARRKVKVELEETRALCIVDVLPVLVLAPSHVNVPDSDLKLTDTRHRFVVARVGGRGDQDSAPQGKSGCRHDLLHSRSSSSSHSPHPS